jgi:SulP family sulfate permease
MASWWASRLPSGSSCCAACVREPKCSGAIRTGCWVGIDTHGLPAISEHFVVQRFDGSLNFVNLAYFEEAVLQALKRFSRAKAILLISNGINDVDVSGEEKLHSLALQLRDMDVALYFSSQKQQVVSAFGKGELSAVIPADHIFKTKELALAAMGVRYGNYVDDVRSIQTTLS